MSEITEHKIISTIDQETKDIVIQDEFIKRKKNLKAKGYSLVYIQELMEISLMFSSTIHFYIVMDLLKNETSSDFKLEIDYKRMMKLYGIGKTLATSILTKMISGNLIRGSRGKYDVNPFIIIPSGANDEVVTRKQSRWSYGIQEC